MDPVTIYSAYMRADAKVHDMQRNACLVSIICESAKGYVSYLERINFIPFEDEEDFRDTYDAQAERILFEGKGRRSRLKDESALAKIKVIGDELAAPFNGKIYWEQFIREPQRY